MTAALLTRTGLDASLPGMKRMLMLSAIAAGLAGCVQVSAPDKPIEINLNINIKQEVVVKLQDDAKNLIQNNPGVF
jgi:hypothetical protein